MFVNVIALSGLSEDMVVLFRVILSCRIIQAIIPYSDGLKLLPGLIKSPAFSLSAIGIVLEEENPITVKMDTLRPSGCHQHSGQVAKVVKPQNHDVVVRPMN